MGHKAACVSVGEQKLEAALLGSDGCFIVLSCSLAPLVHVNVFNLIFEIALSVSVTHDRDEHTWVYNLRKLSKKGEDRRLTCCRVHTPCSRLAATCHHAVPRVLAGASRLRLLLLGFCCPWVILNELDPMLEWGRRRWCTPLGSVSLAWAAVSSVLKDASGT